MSVSIALIGAGGKMGFRLSANLARSDFEVRHVEVSETGRNRLRDELGVTCVDSREALDGADAVSLAVPDTLIGKISSELEPQLESGTLVIVLDAAAPFAGHLPDRDDLVLFRDPSLSSVDLQRRDGPRGETRLLWRRQGQAGGCQRVDAGA